MATVCSIDVYDSPANRSAAQHCSPSQHYETDDPQIEADIVQEETGVNGVSQEANRPEQPIVLHAKYGHCHSVAYSERVWKYEESDLEAKTGRLGVFIGFYDLKVERIEGDKITLTRDGSTYVLTPGESLRFYAEIEGREWSDGCVYDSDEYSLTITWN